MSIRQTEKKITALYERLSCDDDLAGDSNSIINQKKYLMDYAEQHGFENCVHYTDDGWSGGNFERPAWKKLINDITAGKVATVLAKDLSRIGREYLQTGYYTELFFPENGVRFIAIGNNIDSQDQTSSEFAPFLNVMNEFYLRDQSRKQRASYQSRSNAGQSISNQPIYGFKKDPDQKHHWLIDEDAAKVVKRVFALAVEGNGPGVIAGILRRDQIERPSVYFAKQGIGSRKNTVDMSRPYDWSAATIARMLSYREYLGHTVNFKTHIESYKTKKQIPVPLEEQTVIENTHEAIVDQETWDLAQKARGTKHRTDKTGIANPLTGLVFCADCGRKMYNHRGKLRTNLPNNGIDPVTGLLPDDDYDCSTHSQTFMWTEHKCSTHRIRTKALHQLILDAIRATSEFAISNQEEFRKRLMEEAEIHQAKEARELKKLLEKAQHRLNELELLIKKLYESYAMEKITEKRFDSFMAEYEKEQELLEQEIQKSQEKLEAFTADQDRVNCFLRIAKKYTDFTVLTPQMIYEFVDKIYVHKPVWINGERTQQVDIHLKYVGHFSLPESSDAEENEVCIGKQKDPKRRAYFREYKRKQKAKAAQQDNIQPDASSMSNAGA